MWDSGALQQGHDHPVGIENRTAMRQGAFDPTPSRIPPHCRLTAEPGDDIRVAGGVPGEERGALGYAFLQARRLKAAGGKKCPAPPLNQPCLPSGRRSSTSARAPHHVALIAKGSASNATKESCKSSAKPVTQKHGP